MLIYKKKKKEKKKNEKNLRLTVQTAMGYWWVKMSSGGLKRGLKMEEVSRKGGQLFKMSRYGLFLGLLDPNHNNKNCLVH